MSFRWPVGTIKTTFYLHVLSKHLSFLWTGRTRPFFNQFMLFRWIVGTIKTTFLSPCFMYLYFFKLTALDLFSIYCLFDEQWVHLIVYHLLPCFMYLEVPLTGYTRSLFNQFLSLQRIVGAAVAQWIHLHFPSCCPGFESQAHNLRFYQFKFGFVL